MLYVAIHYDPLIYSDYSTRSKKSILFHAPTLQYEEPEARNLDREMLHLLIQKIWMTLSQPRKILMTIPSLTVLQRLQTSTKVKVSREKGRRMESWQQRRRCRMGKKKKARASQRE